MKSLIVLTMALDILARSLMYLITWEEIPLREDFVRTTPPAMVRVFLFQPASFFLISTKMNWNSLLLGFLWKIG